MKTRVFLAGCLSLVSLLGYAGSVNLVFTNDTSESVPVIRETSGVKIPTAPCPAWQDSSDRFPAGWTSHTETANLRFCHDTEMFTTRFIIPGTEGNVQYTYSYEYGPSFYINNFPVKINGKEIDATYTGDGAGGYKIIFKEKSTDNTFMSKPDPF